MKTRVRFSGCLLYCVAVLPLPALAGGGDVDGDGVPDVKDQCPNTPAGILVDALGRPMGDLEGDCDVDLGDVAFVLANLTGPLTPTPEEAACDDGLDDDGDGLTDCQDVSDCPVGTPCGGALFCSQFATCGCPGWSLDCDNDPLTGCEIDSYTDAAHCGGCDLACFAPNAIPACVERQCSIGGCNSGWCDADLEFKNGCEEALDSNPPCAPDEWGVISGDGQSSPLKWIGRGEDWLTVRITEDDLGDVDLSARIELYSPANTNYDLVVRCHECGGVQTSSLNGPGQIDTIYVGTLDDAATNDFDVIIEVRWVSGGCGTYVLTATGNVGEEPSLICP